MSTTSKTATVIRHIHFEDLGIFAQPLIDQGYAVAYHDVGLSDDDRLDLLSPDLLVVLGGPIGVYEVEAYPFMSGTIAQLRQRLAENRPTLGICLGAQLMAAALDAEVGPMGHKEIGFGELTLTEDGAKGPLRHIVGQPVLHWHGDAFQIPEGAANLATTALCGTQAFSRGHNLLALQFHPEVDIAAGIERWLIGHASELAGAKIDPRALRAEAQKIGSTTRAAGQAMLTQWLEGLQA
ncbi:glutamine amidotransferase [Novosphingobium sp.]|uniref:glutamine amidotransferase n=1 Tax=Novosphingobium sp. TaxID=1874826 RepID=UPI0031D89DA8